MSACRSIPLLRRIVLLLGAVIVASTPAAAFRPEFCAKIYEADRIALTAEWYVGSLAFRDKRQVFQKMNQNEWQSCTCYGSQCSCCQFDLQKVCAELTQINTTTMNQVRLGACEQR